MAQDGGSLDPQGEAVEGSPRVARGTGRRADGRGRRAPRAGCPRRRPGRRRARDRPRCRLTPSAPAPPSAGPLPGPRLRRRRPWAAGWARYAPGAPPSPTCARHRRRSPARRRDRCLRPRRAERPSWSFAELEERLTGRLLAYVGGTAVLLGAVLFLSLAFTRGWIDPAGRVAIGLVGAMVLFGLGAWLFETRPQQASWRPSSSASDSASARCRSSARPGCTRSSRSTWASSARSSSG